MENYEVEVQALMEEQFIPADGRSSALVERLRQAIVDGNLDSVKECAAIAENIGGDDGIFSLVNAIGRDEKTPLFTALEHYQEAKSCFHYFMDNRASIVNSGKDGDEMAMDYALYFERSQINWDPAAQSLYHLIKQVSDKSYDGSPILRLFEEDRYGRAYYASRTICGRDFKDDVIDLAIVLRLNAQINDNNQIDLAEIYTSVGKAFTWDCSTNSRKLLICQALLVQQGEINVNAESETRQDLLLMHAHLVRDKRCFGCKEVQEQESHLWENRPCSHVLWCAKCKEWLMRMTQGVGSPHTCIICGEVVASTLPFVRI